MGRFGALSTGLNCCMPDEHHNKMKSFLASSDSREAWPSIDSG
jgi:hypothetical protein